MRTNAGTNFIFFVSIKKYDWVIHEILFALNNNQDFAIPCFT